MARNTLTLALDGDVSLSRFADAMQAFQQLVSSLTSEVTPHVQVRWVVSYLEAGSAEAAVRGEPTQEGVDVARDIERIVDAYDRLGEAAEFNRPIPFSPPVQVAVGQLTDMLNGDVRALRFDTDDRIHVVSAPPTPSLPPLAVRPEYLSALGAVTGRIETLQHRAMRFSLYELLDDLRVTCFLVQGQEPLVDRAWGKLATVEGLVRRDARTGAPVAIREIETVQIFEDPEVGAWRRSAGVAPAPTDAPPPEETIRRLRDDG